MLSHIYLRLAGSGGTPMEPESLSPSEYGKYLWDDDPAETINRCVKKLAIPVEALPFRLSGGGGGGGR